MIKDTSEAIELLKEYYQDDEELKTAIDRDNISDTISEIADSNVDIYNSDLLEWLAGNYSVFEEAIDEFGFPNDNGKADLMRAIMQGQYYQNEQILYEAIEDLKD